MALSDDIILVDERDTQIGTGEKMAVHRAGKLHRCFSIFVFNGAGKLLLQQRALGKYHCGGLWTNTCCGHPRPGEDTGAGARRRLKEEFGFDCDLREAFSFTYRAEFDNGLTEHEFDHVLMGRFDDEPQPDPAEIADWKWVELAWLRQDMKENPASYSPWLKDCFEQALRHASQSSTALRQAQGLAGHASQSA